MLKYVKFYFFPEHFAFFFFSGLFFSFFNNFFLLLDFEIHCIFPHLLYILVQKLF